MSTKEQVRNTPSRRPPFLLAKALLWRFKRATLKRLLAPMPKVFRDKWLARLGPDPMPSLLIDETTMQVIAEAAAEWAKLEEEDQGAAFMLELKIRYALRQQRIRGSLNVALQNYRTWYLRQKH